jgi:carboxypeptidase D
MRNDPQHWSSAYDYRVLDNIIRRRYLDNDQIYNVFMEMQTKHMEEVSIESEKTKSNYYHSVKVTSNVSFFCYFTE